MKYLFLIDFQRDFIDGPLGTPEAQAIVPRVVEKIKNFKGRIIYTKDTHLKENFEYPQSIEEKRLPQHGLMYENGWKLNKEILDILVEECCKKEKIIGKIIVKDTFGINYDTWNKFFEDEIKNGYTFGEDEIEICGLCTDICVITNALALRTMFLDNIIKVDASCCAGSTPEKHKAALEVMKSCLIDVINE